MLKVYRELLIRCDFMNRNGKVWHEYLTREAIKEYSNMIEEHRNCGIRMLMIDYNDTYEKIEYSDTNKEMVLWQKQRVK